MAAYIVNTSGATHAVDPDTAARMIEAGDAREASPAEVAAWYERQGLANPHAEHTVETPDGSQQVVAAEPIAEPVRDEPVGDPSTLRTSDDEAVGDEGAKSQRRAARKADQAA